MGIDLSLGKVAVAVLTGLPEVHELDVLFLFADVNELSAVPALAYVSAAVGIVTVDLARGELPPTVFAVFGWFAHLLDGLY